MEKLAGAPPCAVGEHMPHHCDRVVSCIECNSEKQHSVLYGRHTRHPNGVDGAHLLARATYAPATFEF